MRWTTTRTAHPALIDGAVFAFVQGTDPEAVLLIEAVRRDDRTVWQYAFGRRDRLQRRGAARPLGRLDLSDHLLE